MHVYLDTSAAVKLVLAERETPALRAWLRRRSGPHLVSSALLRVELIRAVGSFGSDAIGQARALLRSVDQLELGPSLLDDAATIGPPLLRTLDAVHVASARRVGPDLEAVVTYDLRMIEAARVLGLPVAHPGLR